MIKTSDIFSWSLPTVSVEALFDAQIVKQSGERTP
jgi:hypothetical protein